MVHRLVLGCGAIGVDLLEAMPPGEGLTVITADTARAESLREVDIPASEGDPTTPGAHADDVDVVIVAGDEAEPNRQAAEAARDAFPDALLVVYTGAAPDSATAAALETVADRVIDPVAALASRVLGYATGPESARARGLLSALRGAEEPVAVITHDNPDPDAIASAVALCRVAESIGVEADPCYFGEISHQENRALVNLLDLPLVHLEDDDIETYGGIALVDHSRPAVNDSLPEETEVDIVIDHHPPRAPVVGEFVDLRSDVGATSTLLTEYLTQFDVTADRQTATALLYGIQIDTKEFTREVAEADFEAAAVLIPSVDTATLSRVESPSLSMETLSVLANAIEHRSVRGGALSTCVGEIHERDALAQAAERLLDMEGIDTTLVYGFMNETIYASGRSRGSDIDLGETLRNAFGDIGDAGGHADMAGAQIPMGVLGAVEQERTGSLTEIVWGVVDDRFFEALEEAPSAPEPEDALQYDHAPEGTASLAFADDQPRRENGSTEAPADGAEEEAGTGNGAVDATEDSDEQPDAPADEH
ncbi:MAG: DHH family phosphoesterase [Halolamina sp.]|uniref:DHH family phosphoesterase n=1 Tax=Halolamina sp. TaxID=1940283 RepID=UPI002FC29DE4